MTAIRQSSVGATARYLVVALSILYAVLGTPWAVFARWQFGTYQLSVAAEVAPLQERLVDRAARRALDFLGGVGGVNFGATAVPSEPLRGKRITLNYRPSMLDEHRLEVTIDGETYSPRIPDWQLKPIALYADSDDTAAVTLFGEGTNALRYAIAYHPALRDTLLGLRLLQADMLLIDPMGLIGLPRYDGSVVRGMGEAGADHATSQQAAKKLDQLLQRHNRPVEWLLNDLDTAPTLHINGRKLYIAVSPFYYFWEPLRSYGSPESQSVVEEARQQQSYYESYIAKLRQNSLPIFTGETDDIKTRLAHIETRITGVIELTEATDELKRNSELLQVAEPNVYDASIQTAGFSAFFRYIKQYNKQHNLRDWQNFLDQLKTVAVQPTVRTPTQWDRPGVPEIERAFREVLDRILLRQAQERLQAAGCAPGPLEVTRDPWTKIETVMAACHPEPSRALARLERWTKRVRTLLTRNRPPGPKTP